MKKGSLFLIPSFLAESNSKELVSPFNIQLVSSLEIFIVENLRTARRFLRKIDFIKSFDAVIFYELNKHTEPNQLPSYLNPCMEGKDIGLLSEAGSPCIADPGASIVALAHQAGITVVPLIGPSSILLALIASGFNGQNFAFYGYLPIDKKEREQKILEMEQKARNLRQTQIFMETPFRNNALLNSILSQCRKDTLLCIASEITHENQEKIQTFSVEQWRKNSPDLHKKTCVFLIYS